MKQTHRNRIGMVSFFFILISLLPLASAAAPQLEVSESVLDFGPITRPKSKSMTLSVVNRSPSPYLGSIAIEKEWLSSGTKDLSLSTGKKQDVIFTVDSSALEPGDYETHVYFRDLMGSTKAELVAKAVIIEGKDDPILKLDRKTIDFKQVVREEQPLAEFNIENVGSGILKGTVHYPEWLRGEEVVELHFTQKRLYYMRAFTSDFTPGTHTREIKIETNGVTRVIPVTIKIVAKEDDPVLAFSPLTVDFGAVRKGKKGRMKVKVINKGKGRLTGTLTYPEWIEGDEEFKELEKSKEINLVANPSKLPLGLTKDVIKVTSRIGMLDIPVKIFVKVK